MYCNTCGWGQRIEVTGEVEAVVKAAVVKIGEVERVKCVSAIDKSSLSGVCD